MCEQLRIDRAIESLTLGLDFKLTEQGYTIRWSDQNLEFLCLKKYNSYKRAIAVGTIHSLICHNTKAILENKVSFEYNVNGEQVVLKVLF